MLISGAFRLPFQPSIHLSASSLVCLWGLRKALTVTWLWKVSRGCSHKYSFIYRYDLTYFGGLIIAGMVNWAPDVRDGKYECYFAKSKCTTCRRYRLGFFLYLPFFLYFLPVATLAVTVSVTVDGAMMRRWCAQVLNAWQPVPQYDSMLNASDFALLASRCEQFCIICTAHCRA